MKALIFGHSQSGGLGLELARVLKKAKVDVTRVTKVGWNDAKLLGYLPSVPKGPYKYVFLYVGGNSDNPTPVQINKLVEHFKTAGADVSVILPPVNTERTKKGGATATAALRAKNAGNRKGIVDVRVYEIEGTNADFEPDQIHMRASSAASKTLAQKMLANLGLGAAQPTVADATPPTSTPGGALIASVVIALIGATYFLMRK